MAFMVPFRLIGKNFILKRRCLSFVFLFLLVLLIYYYHFENDYVKNRKIIYNCNMQGDATVPNDSVVKCEIRAMAAISWRGYVQACKASSGNEWQPISNYCNTGADEIVGAGHLLTAVDALDTLYLLGMKKEFTEARELIKNQFKLQKGLEVNVFEVTIRLLGGFLGAFSLTLDPLFKEKAKEVGDSLMGAFINELAEPKVKLFGDAKNSSRIFLAEAGSLYLEFMFLSEITGNPQYARVANKNQELLMRSSSMNGLYPVVINRNKNALSDEDEFSIGGRSDSFYEYLVKRCLFDQPVRAECRRVFTKSLDAIMKELTVNLGKNGVCLVTKGKRDACVMEHLSCFAGGMYALAYLQDKKRTDWLQLAKGVTQACYLSYKHSPTGLGSEVFAYSHFSHWMKADKDSYILRPEVIESIFYLHRVTGDKMYKEWGWRIVQALQKYAFTGRGYSGLFNMQSKPRYDNVQQSFFLAETLKYLYLLFSESDHLSLSEWTFNTEAHLLPTNRNRLRAKMAAMIRRS